MNENLSLNLPKKWLSRVVVFLFISACFYACQKQEHEPPEEDPIAVAKAYFDRQQKSSTVKSSGASFLADSLLESRRVDWPSAFSQQKGDTVTIFVPLRFPFAIRTKTIDQEKTIFLNDLMYLRITNIGKVGY